MSRKFFEKVAMETRLTYDSAEKILHGNYNGYYFMVNFQNGNKRILVAVFARFQKSEDQENPMMLRIKDDIKAFTMQKQHIEFYYAKMNEMMAGIKVGNCENDVKNVIEVLDSMANILRDNRLYSCCHCCGGTMFLSGYKVNSYPTYLCNECGDESLKMVPKKRIKKTNNPLIGILCGLFGGVIGAVVWVVMFQVGYITAIAGVATFALTYMGYTLFYRSNAKRALLVAGIVSVIMVFLGQFSAWALDFYMYIKPVWDITIIDAYKLTVEMMFLPEYIGDFMIDLVIGYALMAVTCVPYAIADIKSPKTTKGIVKLE